MARRVELKVGWTAPPLEGVLASGERFRLAALRPGPVLVEFHRGVW